MRILSTVLLIGLCSLLSLIAAHEGHEQEPGMEPYHSCPHDLPIDADFEKVMYSGTGGGVKTETAACSLFNSLSPTSCYYRPYLNNFASPINQIIPITYFTSDCNPTVVTNFRNNHPIATYNLNNAVRGMGIYFNGTAVVVPCNGWWNVSSWAQVQSFHTQFNTASYKSMRVLVLPAAGAYGSYSGVYSVGGSSGWIRETYLTSKNTVPHELGHGFGLKHTFHNTDLEDGLVNTPSGCQCAEMTNVPDYTTGDFCEDSSGCPQTQTSQVNIPYTSLIARNPCPKSESFYINPVQNVMSYNFPANPVFSNCQILRMKCVYSQTLQNNLNKVPIQSVNCFGKTPLDVDVCSGFGNCWGNNSCSCLSGYTGNNCSTWFCNGIQNTNPSVCSGSVRGTCTASNQCTCNAGYHGTTCQNTFSCYGRLAGSPTVCSGRGTCIAQNTCRCNAGFTGNDCFLPICYGVNSTSPLVCSGNGVCSGEDNCTCKAGYLGFTCSIAVCNGIPGNSPSVCSGNGTCTAPNVCTCNTCSTGNNCENNKNAPGCFSCYGVLGDSSRACNANGNCTAPNNCTCATSFSGIQCEFLNCYGTNYQNLTSCDTITDPKLWSLLSLLAIIPIVAFAAGMGSLIVYAIIKGTSRKAIGQ